MTKDPTLDACTGFSASLENSWAVLKSDGLSHPVANAQIMHMLMVSAAHQTPIRVTLAPGPVPGGAAVITSVAVDFSNSK